MFIELWVFIFFTQILIRLNIDDIRTKVVQVPTTGIVRQVEFGTCVPISSWRSIGCGFEEFMQIQRFNFSVYRCYFLFTGSLRTELESLRASKESLQTKLKSFMASKASHRSELESLRASNESLQTETESLRSSDESRRIEIITLKSEIDCLVQSRVTLKSYMDHLIQSHEIQVLFHFSNFYVLLHFTLRIERDHFDVYYSSCH
jgi:hypothetical protein